MNSHIVEKTMHSIKNIDRLTDLAVIDVYNTTHDTINKYEIMKEHATEEYTNESFYQESVLAGVLIGAGILGVAVSAFFIIKKIIDSKSQVTTKNSDGSTSVAVDLSDPKSTEKFIAKLKERASKLNADTKVTTSQSINPEAAEKEIAILEEVVQQFQEIIDNKDDTAKIKSILSGLKTDTDFNQLTNQAFVSGNKEITLGNYVEELGIGEMVNFSKKINELKTKCDKAEKTINGMKANKETDSSTEGITDAEIKSLKDFSTLVAKALDSMLNKSNAMCSSANTILDQAEEDAKKPKEEAKPETSEAEKKDESKTETDKSKPEVQPTADTKAGAGGNDNTGTESSTSENVMGPGGQTEAMQQASEAKEKEAAEAQNKNVLYLNPKEKAQDTAENPVIPAAAENRANEKTLEDVVNMLTSGKSEEDITNYLKQYNYKDDQIADFLAKAKEPMERKNKMIEALKRVGTPDSTAKAIASEICDTHNGNLSAYVGAKIAENPGNDKVQMGNKQRAYSYAITIANALGIDPSTIPNPKDENSELTPPVENAEKKNVDMSEVNKHISITDINNAVASYSMDNITREDVNKIAALVYNDIQASNSFNPEGEFKEILTEKINGNENLDFEKTGLTLFYVLKEMVKAYQPKTPSVESYAASIHAPDFNSLKSPEEVKNVEDFINEIFNEISKIPTSASNNAKKIAESPYDDSTKRQIANTVIKKLQDVGQDSTATGFANILNKSYSIITIVNNNTPINIDAAAESRKTAASDTTTPPANPAESNTTDISTIANDIDTSIHGQLSTLKLSEDTINNLMQKMITGSDIINAIDKSISDARHVGATGIEATANAVQKPLSDIYTNIHSWIISVKKGINVKALFGKQSIYGQAVTNTCEEVRQKVIDYISQKYHYDPNQLATLIPTLKALSEKMPNIKKWYQEYQIEIIREEKLKMIQEQQTDPEE